MQQLLLSVMLSPLPPGASEADSVLGLALLALLANAGKRHMLSCCHAVLCALCMLAACGHLQLAAGSRLPSSLPCPAPAQAPASLPFCLTPSTHAGYLARLQCITLVQAFYAGNAAAQEHVRCLLEDPMRWALHERLMELMGGVLGLALGATCGAQPPAKAAAAEAAAAEAAAGDGLKEPAEPAASLGGPAAEAGGLPAS